uniref:IgGFc-binding protein N-terminal domain-containing protein n=1 Tax=Panagrolaimus sp. JU765 TaxID=591449 RepID=A0AC34PW47_9BILA
MTQKFLVFCLFYNIFEIFGQTIPDTGTTVSLPPNHGPKPDTAGTLFRYAFTTNAQKTYPDLELHFIGQDSVGPINVTITYDSLVTKETVVLQATGNSGKIKLAANEIVWHYLNNGLYRQPNTVLFITATAPVRLYALNQDPDTKQMDITTVLPISMAGTNYIVTLPLSYPSKIYDTIQFQVLYFIPATLDDYLNNTITVQMINGDRKEKPVSRTYNGLNYLYYFDCDQYGYDLHAADNINAVNFYVAPPVWTNCPTEPDNIYSQFIYSQLRGDRIGYSNAIAFQSPLTVISDASTAFRSDSALLQITRLGGVDLEGHNSGAFLTHVPGIGSFVQGVQYFPIFSQDAHLEVVTTGTTVTVNGIPCEHRSVLPNPLGQWFYFLCNITGGPDVLHYVNSTTPFMATVIGHDDSGLPIAYGFEVAYNSPRIGAPYTY